MRHSKAFFGSMLGCLLLTVSAKAQTAEVSGIVLDPSLAPVRGATVTAVNQSTLIRTTTASNRLGHYRIPFMQPGWYTISSEASGLNTVQQSNVRLDPGQAVQLDLVLRLASPNQTITVRETTKFVSAETPGVGTTVDQQFVEGLPLNGRTFQALILLTPGAVQTSGDGQFSINGQRDNGNYLTVDGVSANVGISSFRLLAQTAGGSVPGFNVIGATHNLVALDAMQEFRVQTSSYSAEFGRSPGGQLQIVTRSGTDQLHGSVFDYLRNDALDANDWFANAMGLSHAPLRQSDLGALLSGPLVANRLFFLFSYEGLRLTFPRAAKVMVPSESARELAPVPIKQLLNAFPRPNGAEDRAASLAPFSACYSEPTSVDGLSARIDHAANNRFTWFSRLSYSTSSSRTRVDSLTHVIRDEVNTGAVTVGATAALDPSFINELRANFTAHRAVHFNLLDDFGGAVPPPDSLMFPSPYASPRSSRFIFTTDDGLLLVAGRSSDHMQRQTNLVDNLSVLKGEHRLKFGGDYRYLDPLYRPQDYVEQVRYHSVTDAASGGQAIISVSIFDPKVFVFHNLSLYAQDTWRMTRRLTLDYGLRWELNPAPGSADARPFYTLTDFGDPAHLRLAPPGTPLYRTTYRNFAPRIGAAYRLSGRTGRETVLRGGAGTFFDLGTGTIGGAADSFPYSPRKTTVGVSFPNADAASPPPIPSLDPPYAAQTFRVFSSDTVLPRTYQWNVSLEQSLGARQTLSASYVGGLGRKLLRRVLTTGPSPNFILGSQILLTDNSATSDYHALQIRFERELSRGLKSLLTYTWSHSLDIASNDNDTQISRDKLDPQSNRGSSDFDTRHVFNAAFIYQVPALSVGRIGKAALGNWSLGGIFFARSATPVDITLQRFLGLDFVAARPDLVLGVPLYIEDSSIAGGRRINPAAFAIPAEMRQGTLGRNVLRGLPANQLDLSMRRQFRLGERLNLQGAADFFNALNHPTFANPDGSLGTYTPPLARNSFFGVPSALVARSRFGGFTQGLTSVYRTGGPRSVQLSLRLGF